MHHNYFEKLKIRLLTSQRWVDMGLRDDLSRDVMMGIGLTNPLPHYTTEPICPDDPPLDEPILTTQTNITPFVDFLIAQGWKK